MNFILNINKILKKYSKEKLLYLLIDRPTEISKYNSNAFVWLNNKKQFHRNYDLPAYMSEIYFEWIINDNVYNSKVFIIQKEHG